MAPKTLSTYDFETITVSTAAIGFTKSKITVTPQCKEAEVYVESNQVRFRKDGTDPTSAVGEPLNDNDRLYLKDLNDIHAIRFIRTGASDATLTVHYRR